jgi:voltage-gated potassium channel
MDLERRRRLYDRVDRATQLPMLVLAVLMIPLIIIPFVVNLSDAGDGAFIAANWVVWAAFAAELVTKTYLSPNRRRYLITHWFDVLIVVVPFLRPLRIAQSARALRGLHALRLLAVVYRSGLTGRTVLNRHGLQYVLATALVVVIAIAGFVTLIEESADDRTIGSFPTALWWSATTVTTVGYGDTAPVTAEGRALGVVLMFVGIGLFGVFTANIASFFVRADRDNEDAPTPVADEVRRLRDQIADLQAAIERSNGTASNRPL